MAIHPAAPATMLPKHQANTEPIVRRPVFNKPKKSSRLSFGPSTTANASSGDSEDPSNDSIFTPKKSTLSRLAASNALKARASTENLSLRGTTDTEGDDEETDDAPTYSASYLQELRNATPRTPASSSDDDANLAKGTKELDIAAKFGVGASTSTSNPLIPSEAEIREKKERRARLAREEQAEEGFIGLDEDDEEVGEETEDEFGNVVLRRKSAKGETRLVREEEDEDLMEDLVEEGGRVVLGRKAEREERRRRRKEREEMIRDAEEGDEDEGARHVEFERSQTAAGTYGLSYQEREERERREKERARLPKKVVPNRSVSEILKELRDRREEMKNEKEALVKQLDELIQEGEDIANDEQRVEQLLKQKEEELQKLVADIGKEGVNGGSIDVAMRDRGLESYGATPVGGLGAEDSSDESD
ncbi:MAG: hypothetical protein M1820_002918 [Bogoriella megaspora]|nr:MAG: hypothetical protein M1820_002918 [Bogoriella megaspora]